ncbi:MAG: chemotaxis protein CheR [Vulcanimicrobiaceae bacterium]
MVEQIVEAGGEPAPPVERQVGRENALPDLELQLLLEAVFRYSGYDFRDYAQNALKRRISERMRSESVTTISGLQERVLHDPQAMQAFIFAMSANANTLFRDAEFFRLFREQVVPLLRTYSFVRLWFPGCSTGEDVYAIATILAEHQLLEKCMIYATDISEVAITTAKAGTFAVSLDEDVAADHKHTGAQMPLSQFAEVGKYEIRFKPEVSENIIFARHSLATDGSLNEFHTIVARGVLPLFNKALQFRVHNLLLQSLARLGFLCLGSNESLKTTPHERAFRQIGDQPIYRRMR